MRWGKPAQDPKQWHKVYAHLPTRLMDGTWVWLEEVERIDYWASEIPYDAPTWFSWAYRHPKPPYEPPTSAEVTVLRRPKEFT